MTPALHARRAALAAAALLLAAGCARREPPALEGVIVNASDSTLRDVTFFGQRGPVADAIVTVAPHDSARTPLTLPAEDAVFATFLVGGGLHVAADSAVVTPGRSRGVAVHVDRAFEAHTQAR